MRGAGLEALHADLQADRVPMEHFERALELTRASVTEEMDREYRNLARTLKPQSPRGGRIGFAIEAPLG